MKTIGIKIMMLALMSLLAIAPLKAKTLVVYYSFTNNTRAIVDDLQTQIDADVLEVEPAEEGIDYAANNYAIGSALISAIRENPDDPASYPAIKTSVDNLDEYSTVIVAAPLWWSSMAAPMQTFLFTYGSQMAGKNIGLIVSSASSGISGVEADARRLIPGGNFLEPSLWIRSSQTSNCHSMISDWLDDINYDELQAGVEALGGDSGVSVVCANGLLQVNGEFDALRLYDVAGHLLFDTAERSFSTKGLASGIYVAVVEAAGRLETVKIRIDN